MKLELSSVNAGYGKRIVLHDICMSVQEGEFVSLIGNNGAGKTTLLLAISGIVTPASGEIKIGGRDTASLAAHERVQIGVGHVPQGRQLFPSMTVEENLQLGAVAAGRRDEARESLEAVFSYFPRLHERRRQRAGSLSGGEQQMVAVARALMGKPSLLLLDEPSAGLAPLIIDTLADVLSDLHRDGMTVLLVEQNASLALDLAQRAHVLETGYIVEQGTTEELRGSERVRRAYLGI